MTKKKYGKIFIPCGRLVQPEEMIVATILSWTGNPVRFLSEQSFNIPDIEYLGLEWEIKSPRGASRHTIENNIRAALRQSSNIVINLQSTKLPDQKYLGYVRQQIALRKQIRNLLVITKKQQIVFLKSN